MEKTHKSGFVNIVGNPNVGKSTLMNRLVGERISIITSKAQTTRHRIMGIVNTEDMQIVYSDTPGVLQPNYKLQESMLNFSQSALGDADVLLFPDIHAGNLVYKAMVHMVDVKVGCILTGTKVPVILTSRSDTFETKVNSIALAAVVAEELKKNNQ